MRGMLISRLDSCESGKLDRNPRSGLVTLGNFNSPSKNWKDFLPRKWCPQSDSNRHWKDFKLFLLVAHWALRVSCRHLLGEFAFYTVDGAFLTIRKSDCFFS